MPMTLSVLVGEDVFLYNTTGGHSIINLCCANNTVLTATRQKKIIRHAMEITSSIKQPNSSLCNFTHKTEPMKYVFLSWVPHMIYGKLKHTWLN